MRFIRRDPTQITDPSENHLIRSRLREIKALIIAEAQVRSDIYALKDFVLSRARSYIPKQFASKCAYCETKLDAQDYYIDWYRPPFGAERENGQIDQHHYVWLIGEWENLYLSCPECAKIKRNIFPSSVSVKYGASINQLRRQRESKVLDPCWDRPEQYLEIDSTGCLRSKKTKGQLTIDFLALNRESLCRARLNALENFIQSWNNSIGEQNRKFFEIYEHLGPQAPYVGSMLLFLWKISKGPAKTVMRHLIEAGPNDADIRFLLQAMGKLSLSSIEYGPEELTSNFEPSETAELAFRPIRSVLIENFKGIRNLQIDIPRFSDQSFAIVGENATGKTSVLQAIALALAGPKEANRTVRDARDVLAEGAAEGKIVIRFHEAREVHEICFSDRSSKFYGQAPRSVKVFGYGPYRLLAKKELNKTQRNAKVRLLSLFRDGYRINGYHGWLNSLSDAQRMDLAEVLQLLLISRETRVSVNINSLRIRTNGKEHPLETLSSGMQSVVSMCTDIMESLYTAGESVLKDGYVILIDELDAHLHPAWRLGILPRLQRAFPNAQLIFSTHDPLTLRGMKSPQIHVLARNDDGVVSDGLANYSDAQSIDYVLTSPLFGLYSTHTREWERQYSEYIELLLKKDQCRITSAEQSQLDWLSQELKDVNAVGDTPRERLTYAVVDRFLASQPNGQIEWDDNILDELAATIQASIETTAERADD
jgi:uncharacterized protein (TIGR02646 family)